MVAQSASREAVQLAARRLAQNAASVSRTLLRGPDQTLQGSRSSVPQHRAGMGVDAAAFRKALPWLQWQELVAFANKFGQRGVVVPDISTALAAEIGKRLSAESSQQSKLEPAEATPPQQTQQEQQQQRRQEQSARDVASVIYYFSKLTPQLSEYEALYSIVAAGSQQGTWAFSRMQRGLVGTAFADAGWSLDGLLAVVRPALHDLSASANLKVDELRFLVHACAHLRDPVLLTAAEVEELARCTRRIIQDAPPNFSESAHLVVSWLQMRVPQAAKEAHLESIHDSCRYLLSFQGERRTYRPAHPLPREGLAPAFCRFLDREDDQGPPLKPPLVRDVVLTIDRICQGLVAGAESRGSLTFQALSVGDWAAILQRNALFCEAYGSPPAWAGDVLGGVMRRAPFLPSSSPGSVDLEGLLSLVRLSRTQRARFPARRNLQGGDPRQRFYGWAAKQLVALREAHGESALLAEAISEVLPCVSGEERTTFARTLLLQSPESRSEATPRPIAAVPASPQLLRGVGRPNSAQRALLAGASVSATSVKVISASSRSAAEAATRIRTQGQVPAAPVARGAVIAAFAEQHSAASPRAVSPVPAQSGSLWGLLASDLPAASARSPETFVRQVVAEAVASQSSPVHAAASVVAAASETSTELRDAAAAAKREEALACVERLRSELEAAVKRVGLLEARLEATEASRSAAAKQTTETKEQRAQSIKASAASVEEAIPPLDAAPSLAGWQTGLFQTAAEASPRVAGAAAALHLHRGFSFEEFRRANSPRLQAERLRVVVPQGNVPVWPMFSLATRK